MGSMAQRIKMNMTILIMVILCVIRQATGADISTTGDISGSVFDSVKEDEVVNHEWENEGEDMDKSLLGKETSDIKSSYLIRQIFEESDLNVTVQPYITFPNNILDNRTNTITVALNMSDRQLILDLNPSRNLLSIEYKELPYNANTKGILSKYPCDWQGVIRHLEEDSMVALSICPVVRGVITYDDNELLMEPTPEASSTKDPHYLTSSTLTPSVGNCGVESPAFSSEKRASNDSYNLQTSAELVRKPRQATFSQHGPLWVEKSTLFVELVLVADNRFYTTFGNDVYSRCRAIVNIVNAIFKKIGVVVVLTEIEVWSSGDKISVTSDYKSTLGLFSSYREKLLREKPHLRNDDTILITTVDFSGDTVGYAHVSGMCSLSKSAGIVQDKKEGRIGNIAQIMAHEMGHNLGLSHDEDYEDCKGDKKKYIMASKTSSAYKPNVGWSSCSRKILMKEKDSVTFQCLKDIPKEFYGTTCGNGIVDPGEQCDCGPEEYCKNSCCIAKTCKLSVNATCASGPCCNTKTCHPHEFGTPCREKEGECDLPEFCSGSNEFCPIDTYKRDGTPCDNNQGYCYRGNCGSPRKRCGQIWGPGTRPADQRCRKINEKGTEEGNCGWTDNTYNVLKKCPQESSECGTLQCKLLSDRKPVVRGTFTYGWMTSGSAKCHHIQGDDRIASFMWLTPDGSPCGNRKTNMCVRQICQEIPPADGYLECPKICSDRGVCNHKGNCHCNPGYAPPDCSTEGQGGSIDSFYSNPKDMDTMIDAILLMIAVIIPIIVCICCSWGKIRKWWDIVGYTSTNRKSSCCANCLNACCCPAMTKITQWIVKVLPSRGSGSATQQVDSGTNASMLCEVNIGINEESMTNSWGVADEKLFTEVVRITPKNSPDISRKIMMSSNLPAEHHRSVEAITRTPAFKQSISVDSGCVSDEDISAHPRVTSQMSMTSLVSAFSKFGNKSVKNDPNKDTQRRSKIFGSQKSIPLSRFVVDPLSGNRSARHGTPPPPEGIRQPYNRSVSTDPVSRGRIQNQEPLLPNSALRTHKSDDDLQRVNPSSMKGLPLLPKGAPRLVKGRQEKIDGEPKFQVQRNGVTPKEKSPPKRCPPAVPSKVKPQQENKIPIILPSKSTENEVLTNGTPSREGSNSPSKRPLMPPKKGPGPITTNQFGGSKKGPILPPKH